MIGYLPVHDLAYDEYLNMDEDTFNVMLLRSIHLC